MKIIYLVTLVICAVSCNQKELKEHNASEIVLLATKEETKLLTTLEFEQLNIDFGEIADTAIAIGEFNFKNSGNQPAIFRQVNPSCGCTVPEYDRGEIPPGSSSQIKVKFTPNTVDKGTQVLQQSHVQLIGNFNDTVVLKVSAIVGK